ncbi:hypothetical protein I4U23_030791 [Adineta vaga]|nr:hypothetical protein I4U23_030791 [Adineta vaga]
MNNDNYIGPTIKPVHRLRIVNRRMKSSTVRDINSSSNTFKRFYQSGGRDYEQYRLWLQTLVKSDTLSTASHSATESGNIKKEPMDTKTNVVSILPSLISSTHSQQIGGIPKISYTHSGRNSQRPFSLPSNSLSESKISVPCDYSRSSITSTSSSLLLNEWSIIDVSRFIEKHFPDKNIARKFIQQKIDGRTLPLLTEDHLIRIFKMKLGPALQLLSLISTLQMRN